MTYESRQICDVCGRDIDKERADGFPSAVNVTIYGLGGSSPDLHFHPSCAKAPLEALRKHLTPEAQGTLSG